MSSSTDGAARGDGVTGKSHHNLAAMDRFDVVVVGGCGHVGLPLALSFADCGYKVGIDDIDNAKIEQVRSGTVPFLENRAEGIDADVAFCPERIAEGHALEEIRSLPQLIGVSSDQAFEKARALFAPMGVQVVRTTPLEAELAKLLTNTWRYMKFAIANQFFQIAHRSGVDYDRVLNAVRQDY